MVRLFLVCPYKCFTEKAWVKISSALCGTHSQEVLRCTVTRFLVKFYTRSNGKNHAKKRNRNSTMWLMSCCLVFRVEIRGCCEGKPFCIECCGNYTIVLVLKNFAWNRSAWVSGWISLKSAVAVAVALWGGVGFYWWSFNSLPMSFSAVRHDFPYTGGCRCSAFLGVSPYSFVWKSVIKLEAFWLKVLI